jgi:hypothetical protein
MRGRKRLTLPDGTSIIAEILEAEVVVGNFGSQLRLKLVVRGGKYSGFEFPDYSKLAKDPKSGEIYYELGTKVDEIFAAAFGEKYTFGEDYAFENLVGKRLMSRVGLSGKNQDRNKLEFGTIGPDPNAGGEAA